MIRAAVDTSDVKEENTDAIDSDTFTPTNKRLGCGCWGSVDVYKDTGGQDWAIKRFSPNDVARKQMEGRGWNREDVMRKESIPLDAAHCHVVPRIIERDKRGEMYVAMPVYGDGPLSEKKNCMGLRDSLVVAKDVAKALNYVHNQEEVDSSGFKKRKAHGDVKPSNILMKKGRAFLNDFGSSTCISIGGNGGKRGAHGDKNYRAPECFSEDANPSVRADVWSLGSVLYEMIAREGIYDGCEDSAKLNKQILRKIRKNTPRKIRKFLKRCLAVDQYKRFRTGSEALGELERTIESFDTKKMIKNHIKKWTLPLGLPVAVVGLCVYGAATYEPQKLEMPQSKIQGMLYPTESSEGDRIEFDAEDIKNLPDVVSPLVGGLNRNAKLSTDNRVVAYLIKTHSQAAHERGMIADVYSDSQFRTFMAYTNNDERQFGRLGGTPWPIWAKSIEVALTQSKTKNGKVDLEDVMAISRTGADKVSEEKRVSRSLDYEVYKNARDVNGNYILPKKEQKFIGTWLSYYHKDLD